MNEEQFRQADAAVARICESLDVVLVPVVEVRFRWRWLSRLVGALLKPFIRAQIVWAASNRKAP